MIHLYAAVLRRLIGPSFGALMEQIQALESSKGLRLQKEFDSKKILGFAKTFLAKLFCNFSDGVVETHPDETVER